MAKKTLYFLGILLTIIIGAILYYNYCCNCKPKVLTTTKLPDSTTNAVKVTDTVTKTDTATKKDTIIKKDTVATDWNAIKEKINANPLVLYFNTGKTAISLTADDRQKASDIVKYIQHTGAAALNIVGYTDNVGRRETNIKVGAERAEFAKDYFIKKGIGSGKISTSSKGPDEPAADNTTAEGRSKNRRTVVTIK